MLVDDKTNKTDNTDTTTGGASTRTGPPASGRPAPSRSRRWVWALAATGAVIGTVTIAAVTQPDQGATNAPSVSDSSYDRVEANRMETLRDLSAGQRSDSSYDRVEANRMETLRDLSTGQRSDSSYDRAEANRMETLRDLSTGP